MNSLTDIAAQLQRNADWYFPAVAAKLREIQRRPHYCAICGEPANNFDPLRQEWLCNLDMEQYQ